MSTPSLQTSYDQLCDHARQTAVLASIESVLAGLPDNTLNQCNLSDIFEYMSEAAYEKILSELIRAGAPGCRLVYWNVVVKRSRPDELSGSLTPLRALARKLHQEDKAFFYRDLVVEEVTKC